MALKKVAVVMIVYKRADLTERVLREVMTYRPNQLFVVSDGPKGVGDDLEVRAVRDLFKNLPSECGITRIYSDQNLGLRARVLSGLDEVFEVVDRAIILEDDCLPNQEFFRFSEELLNLYEDQPKVTMITGNNFASNPKAAESFFFSNHAYIWGWATWAETWKAFRSSNVKQFFTSSELQSASSSIVGGSKRRSFISIARNSAKLDSWAIQFAIWLYTIGGLTAQPKVNLVQNIGFGSRSTHTKFESYADEIPTEKLAFPLEAPVNIELNRKAMIRESRRKSLRWIFFPIVHPISVSRRIINFLMLRAR